MSVFDRIPQNVRSTIRRFRPVIIGVLIFLLVVIIAMSFINSLKPDTSSARLALPTQQLQDTTPTATVFPPGWAIPGGAYTPSAGTPQAAMNFVDGSQWKVVDNKATMKVGRFTYAVVTFQNLSDNTTIKGQCQQPKWPLPAVDDIYTLKNTSNNYWLFIPNKGEEGDFQYFKPMN